MTTAVMPTEDPPSASPSGHPSGAVAQDVRTDAARPLTTITSTRVRRPWRH